MTRTNKELASLDREDSDLILQLRATAIANRQGHCKIPQAELNAHLIRQHWEKSTAQQRKANILANCNFKQLRKYIYCKVTFFVGEFEEKF